MAGGVEDMTKSEALQNAMDALTASRGLQGEPMQIRIDCGEETPLVCFRSWSRSTINNGSQVVFLVVAVSPEYAAALPNAKVIHYGKTVYVISGVIEPPKDDDGYWLLPVREA